MKTLLILATTCILLLNTSLHAQTTISKSTAAVATPAIQGLSTSADVVAKMIRYELYKTQVYQLYDEFDMNEALNGDAKFARECFGVMCLSDLGTTLNVDYVIAGSFDKLSDRIVINMKVINVKTRSVELSCLKEFAYKPDDLQRMIEATLCQMYALPFDQLVLESLIFKNDPVEQIGAERINNTGPRMGAAYMMGGLNEFAYRPEAQGGLDIFPVTSMLGYQFEWQYIGTENFSALVECIVNVSGMEQGRFIPSIDLMNGFRLGKRGWEIGFGPGIGVTTKSQGFFDTDNTFGLGSGAYFSASDWNEYSLQTYGEELPVSDFNSTYSYGSHFDARGETKVNTFWTFAVGRTVQAGTLNIPLNAFYTIMGSGSYAGFSFGFNVIKDK